MTVVMPWPWLAADDDGETVTLTASGRAMQYRGAASRLLALVLPHLDGELSAEQIAERLGAADLTAAVNSICVKLVEDEMALDVSGLDHRPGPDELLRLVSGGRPIREVCDVYVVGDEAEALAVQRVAPSGWHIELTDLEKLGRQTWPAGSAALVWVDDPSDQQLLAWNELAHHQKRQWLPIITFDGQVAITGPLIIPAQTPCFECYRRRRVAALGLGGVPLNSKRVGTRRATTSALTQILAALAVFTLDSWAMLAHPFLPGTMRTVTLEEGLKIGTELVLRVPRCTVCHPVAANARPAPWSDYLTGEAAA